MKQVTLILQGISKKLNFIGSGEFSKVYHDTETNLVYMIAPYGDNGKHIFSHVEGINIPILHDYFFLNENEDDYTTVFVTNYYNKLTKKEYPEAYQNYLVISNLINKTRYDVTKNNLKNDNVYCADFNNYLVNLIEKETRLTGELKDSFISLISMANNMDCVMVSDNKKNNFSVDNEGNLILRDLCIDMKILKQIRSK